MNGGNNKKGGGYAVGYGKPPGETRFKSGQSGNPNGRPKRAKGKHSILMDAINEPTRDIFMSEMKRPITVSTGGKAETMPAIQMITRSMVKTAAEGGQQAQRTAIMLQLELERDAAKKYAEWMKLISELKQLGSELLKRRRAEGLPDLDDLVPHPDDIFINYENDTVEIRGPWNDEQKEALDWLLNEREKYEKGFAGLRAEAKASPRDWTLPMWGVMAQAHVDAINERLPERYRKPLRGRMSDAEIEAARARVRKYQAQQKQRGLTRKRGATAADSDCPSSTPECDA